MTDKIKVLAQANPAATTLTVFYTVPTATSTAVSSIVICNQNAVAQIAFRVSIAINGAADTPSQYIYYDLPLTNNDTFIATVGITLTAGDIIRIYSNNSNVSFSLFGLEIV